MNPTLKLTVVAAATLLNATILVPQASAATCLPGYKPIGGPIQSYPAGTPVHAVVGVELINSSGQALNADGSDVRSAGLHYSYSDRVNNGLNDDATVPGTTTRPPTAETRWGADLSSDDMCVVNAVVSMNLEVYPTNASGFTDRGKYGGSTIHAAPPLTTILLREPAGWANDYSTCCTGYVTGLVKLNGVSVPAANIHINAFPATGTSNYYTDSTKTTVTCGIAGFHGGPGSPAVQYTNKGDQLTNGFYRLSNLAGGKCGAASQSYSVHASCVNAGTFSCGAYAGVSRARIVSVASATSTTVNFELSQP